MNSFKTPSGFVQHLPIHAAITWQAGFSSCHLLYISNFMFFAATVITTGTFSDFRMDSGTYLTDKLLCKTWPQAEFIDRLPAASLLHPNAGHRTLRSANKVHCNIFYLLLHTLFNIGGGGQIISVQMEFSTF